MAYPDTPGERARTCLEGLSVGDAFGERFFGRHERVARWLENREMPGHAWRFTDDTVMAIGIVEVLERCDEIDPDELARVFARKYAYDSNRGYGAGARHILERLGQGVPWQTAAGDVFDGQGSYGNGGAMRAAPIGGYFAGDTEAIVRNARRSAQVTHAHHEGQAGAIAVGLAAGAAFETCDEPAEQAAQAIYEKVCRNTPAGDVRAGIERARDIGPGTDLEAAAAILGNGSRVTAMDTVPFVIWSACAHLDAFEEAMWQTVSVGGDRDTTCAMVAGIIALRLGREAIPAEWLDARERLDAFLVQSA